MIFQETETSELKRVLNDTLPKEIDAFLNSFDGNIYIGVEDDGTVIGLKISTIFKNVSRILSLRRFYRIRRNTLRSERSMLTGKTLW